MNRRSKNQGFTLIEMIGVLAIIAVLVAAVAPRIFGAIRKSKITTMATYCKTLKSAVMDYYADMGTVMPIYNVNSQSATIRTTGYNGGTAYAQLSTALTYTKQANQTGGIWAKFKGPYLDAFDAKKPPIGTEMLLSSMPAARFGNNVNQNYEQNFDLTNSGTNTIANGSGVVCLRVTGVSPTEWEQFEGVYEIDQTDLNTAQKRAQGKVKYNPNQQGGTMRIYITND